MNRKINSYGWDREWGYYPSKMLLFTIPYFLLNLLDLFITKIALATSETLYELNPFYYHSYFQSWKIFVPVLLLVLYLSLYHLNKSQYARKAIGQTGLGCIVALTILSLMMCINNVCQLLWVA